MRVYSFDFCFCFFRGDRIDPVVLECYKRAHSNGNEKFQCPFLSDQKNWRAPTPPPTLIIYPESPDQNSQRAILFNIVENPHSHVFGDDLVTHSPHGRGYKLKILTSAYIQKWLLGSVQTFSGGFFGWGWFKRGGYSGGAVHGGICHRGRKFP